MLRSHATHRAGRPAGRPVLVGRRRPGERHTPQHLAPRARLAYQRSRTRAAVGAAALLSVFLVQPAALAVPVISSTNLLVSASSLNFGGVPVGTTSAPQVVTVTNLGTASQIVSVQSVTFPFVLTASSCNSVSLSFLQSCSVSIAFDPSTTGAANGTLSIGASAAPQIVPLSGTGTASTAVVFGQTVTFTSTPPANPTGGTYTVTATASSGLPVSLSIDGSTPPSVCTISGSVVTFVGPGFCTIDANQGGNGSFSPAPQAQQTVQVLSTSPISQPLLSTTTDGNGQIFNGTLAFGSVVVGSMSTPQVLDVTGADLHNTLLISTVGVSGPYVVSSTTCAGAALKLFQMCTINVMFEPTFTGPATGTLFLNDNGVGSPQTVNLTGTGIAAPPVLLPQTITYTSTPPTNPTGGTYTVSARASSGLPVTFTIDGSSSAMACFIIGSTVTFGSPGSCVIDANQAGNANFAAAPQVQQIVTVAGPTGSLLQAPLFFPSTLNFGAVKVGSFSAPQTAILLNQDPAHSVTIFSGGGVGPFVTIGGTCTATPTLAPLQSCTLVVTFDPTNTGTASGLVDIFDNAGTGTQMVILSGTGV